MIVISMVGKNCFNQNMQCAVGEVSVRGAYVFTTHNTFPRRYFAIFEVNPRETTVTSADLTEARQVRAAYLLGEVSLLR